MTTIGFAIRVVALIAIHFICFALVSAALIPRPAEQPTPADAGSVIGALLLVSVLNTIVLSYIIRRSDYGGWRLAVAVFLAFYGVMTVLPQIETAFFVKLPSGMLSRLFLSGAVFSAIFSVFSVLVLGKRRTLGADSEKKPLRLNMPVVEWLLKLALIIIAYVTIYFTFGYFIAWKSKAVRSYYGGNDPGSFLAQMESVLRNTPFLLPLQVLRAILWTSIAVVVIRVMKGRRWEAALAVALLFTVMSAQLLIPNPLMPREVRMVHLLETASSNFIFGWLVVMVLLAWKPLERRGDSRSELGHQQT